jgi:hypothetical protein
MESTKRNNNKSITNGARLAMIVSLHIFPSPSPTRIQTANKKFIGKKLTPSDIVEIKQGAYWFMMPYLVEYVNSLSAISPSIDYYVPIPIISKWTVSLCGLVMVIEFLMSRQYDCLLYKAYRRISVTKFRNKILSTIKTIDDVTSNNQILYIAIMECLLTTLTDEEKVEGYVKLNDNLTITTNYKPLLVGSTEDGVDGWIAGWCRRNTI